MNLQHSYEDYLEKRMLRRHDIAVAKLESVISHPQIVESFGLILAWAFREEDLHAEKIAELLNLNEEDLCALEGNYETLERIVEEERINQYI
jgi:hypothetical protein